MKTLDKIDRLLDAPAMAKTIQSGARAIIEKAQKLRPALPNGGTVPSVARRDIEKVTEVMVLQNIIPGITALTGTRAETYKADVGKGVALYGDVGDVDAAVAIFSLIEADSSALFDQIWGVLDPKDTLTYRESHLPRKKLRREITNALRQEMVVAASRYRASLTPAEQAQLTMKHFRISEAITGR